MARLTSPVALALLAALAASCIPASGQPATELATVTVTSDAESIHRVEERDRFCDNRVDLGQDPTDPARDAAVSDVVSGAKRVVKWSKMFPRQLCRNGRTAVSQIEDLCAALGREVDHQFTRIRPRRVVFMCRDTSNAQDSVHVSFSCPPGP